MITRFWLVTLFGAVFASPASADVLTFDDLNLPDGTEVTDQYAGLGVIFSAPPGGATRVLTASNPIFPDEPQGLYNDDPEGGGGRGFTAPIIADFLAEVSTAGAWIDFGRVGDGIRIEAFDGPGGTGSLLGMDNTVTETFIGVDAPGIRSVVFSQTGDGATYLIDNFTFVPEPASLALLAVGAVFGARRRR